MTSWGGRMVGRTVSHYRVLDQLGEGGMGVVYRAEDTKLGRQVALKFLSPHVACDRAALERFEREARAASALNHPHICTIHDIDEAEGQPFIAMELLEGEPLRAHLAHARLPVSAIVDLATHLADALEAAHAKGIVHRDIKPENVFITTRGAAKLLDFGIAKLVTEQATEAAATVTRIGTGPIALGTVAYMSPEQVRGEALDARTDLFSLGVVLYEMVTGTQPFKGTTSGAVLGEILTKAPTAPVSLNADVPPELERIVNKLLEKDRGLRYQSACDVRVDLDRLRRELTTSTGGARLGARDDRSIVVLPFENLSPDPENAFFADGLTEEIIADLSRVRALRVISRTSAMLLKGARKDLPTIGREMSVRYVLEGSVRRAGNQLRVTAQLIEAATDAHVWAEKFAGTLEDVFEIQEKLSHTIVDALKVRLTADEEALLAARHVRDPHAFDLYLKARELLYREADAVERAENLLRQAIAVAGPNASLYALLGHLHFQAFDSLGRDNTGEAAAWSDAALELSPDCGRAVLVKALLAYKKGQMAAAMRFARKAVQLSPGGDATMWLSYICMFAGNVEEGRQAADAAVASDPLIWGPWVQGMVAMFEGAHERAARRIRPVVEADPTQLCVMLWLAVSLGYAGQRDEAAAVLDASARAAGGGIWSEMSAAFSEALRANREAAAHALASPSLLAAAALHPELAWWTADAFARIGDADNAFRFLGTAIELGVWNHHWWSEVNPAFVPLRGDPRFVALMQRAKDNERTLEG